MPDPATVFQAYETAVTAAGGAIVDDDAVLGLITDLIDAGVYEVATRALVAGGGVKNFGATGATLFSVGPGFTAVPLTAISGEHTLIDDVDGEYLVYIFPNDQARIDIAGLAVGGGDITSVIIAGPDIPSGGGLWPRLTTAGYTYSMLAGQAAVNVALAGGGDYWPEGVEARTGVGYVMPGYEGYVLPEQAVVGWHWNHRERSLFVTDNGRNEPNRGRQFDGFPPIGAGQTADFRLSQSGVSNAAWRDCVVLAGGHRLDQALDFEARRKARFPALPEIYWVRSNEQPTGAQVGATSAGFPAADGTKLAWFSTTNNSGSVWTAAVETAEAAPVTIGTHANLTISGAGNRIVEKTGGSSAYDTIVYTAERAKGGYRLKVKGLSAEQFRMGDEFVIDPAIFTQDVAVTTTGYTGSGAHSGGAASDVYDFIVDFGGNTVTLKRNGATLSTGAKTGALSGAADTRLGLFPYDPGAKVEIVAFLPHGPNARVKVAQTSPDGSAWRVPTPGDAYLRVSNDAGVTAPSIVVG